MQLTLDTVIKRQYVDALAVLDVLAGVDGDYVSELDAQVVSGD